MFKIIIADDEPVIIRGLKKMMNWERLNAEVIGEAANGEELLKKTEELKPDIIISDVAMPRKTGLDVIRQIRENGWKIKVIFLSGYQEFDYVKKAISYEAVDYLLKPVGQEELEQSILRAEKMLRTDSPMEYWEEEKDDMQTVFKKINSEYECRDLYSHFQEMGIETEGKRFVGVCFAISPELNRKVTDRFNEWEDKDALSEAVVKAMTIDDKIVGIPYEMTVRAYLTHEKDLTAAGIEVPKTWEDLLAQTDYKEKNGKYLTELACTGVRSAQELLVYLAQYDLEIASAQDDGKYKNTWKDNKDELDKATKVFQFYKDLVDQGIIDPNCKNWGWEETDENFATGITSTYVSGNWLAERESSNPDTMDDVAVTAIPYPSDGHEATYMECKPLFIMADSKNKDDAFELATAFCSKEWQEAGFADRSPRSDVSTDSKWSKDFQALSDTGITFPPVTLGGITQAMQDAMAKVLQEGETPEATAEWLCDAVNASLSDSGELSE